jgi:hypothetical protein
MTGNEPPAQTPATPPADPAAGGNNQPPAQTPAPQPGTPPAQGEFILSQEQFDKRWAEKMAALERDFGMPLKDVKTHLEQAKPKPPTGETLSGADLKLAKMEALMIAGVPSQQIPVILQHFNISGKTREEIQGSIQQLIDAKLLTIAPPAPAPGTQPQQPPGPPTAAQGAGNNGVPGLSAIATMTKADLAAKCKDPVWYDANRDAVLKRLSELR